MLIPAGTFRLHRLASPIPRSPCRRVEPAHLSPPGHQVRPAADAPSARHPQMTKIKARFAMRTLFTAGRPMRLPGQVADPAPWELS
jgi:hypothetical protein